MSASGTCGVRTHGEHPGLSDAVITIPRTQCVSTSRPRQAPPPALSAAASAGLARRASGPPRGSPAAPNTRGLASGADRRLFFPEVSLWDLHRN